jgi:hypothetical protein
LGCAGIITVLLELPGRGAKTEFQRSFQRATLSQLRDDATDLAGLVREIQKPLQTLPLDATERSWF